ncbi:MAG TPA: hypothetical protein VN884_04440 [Candidatus Sulfotelmatobacter sp.]|nr:hypothetical protein [Candidatus Sulfotelmatobacter sp.]
MSLFKNESPFVKVLTFSDNSQQTTAYPGNIANTNNFVGGGTSTLDEALDNAIASLPASGGEVVVPDQSQSLVPWILTHVVTINKPVHITFGIGTLTFAMADPGVSSGGIFIQSDNVVLEGQGPDTVFTQPNAQNIETCIFFSNHGNITIKNIKFDWNDTNLTNASGFYSCLRSSAGSHDLKVYDCQFTRGGDRAIDFRGANRVWIENNYFFSTGLFTLHAPSHGNSVSVDVDGLTQSTDVWLVNNLVEQQGDSFAAADSIRVHIINNTIRGAADFGNTPTSTESGIDATGNVDCEVSGNQLINVRGPQLGIQGEFISPTSYVPRNVSVTGNTFVANTTAGGLPATQPRVTAGMSGVTGQMTNIAFSNNVFDGVELLVDTVKALKVNDNIFCNVLFPTSQIVIVLDQATTSGSGVMQDFSIQDNIFLTDNSSTQTAVFTTSNVTTPGKVSYFGNLQDANIPNGFTSALSINASNITASRIHTNGIPISNANVTFSGWGSGASIAFVGGTDLAGIIDITAGTTPSANPTITLTFVGGTFGSNPVIVCSRSDGSTPFGPFAVQTLSPTSVTFQANFTPSASGFYSVSFISIG